MLGGDGRRLLVNGLMADHIRAVWALSFHYLELLVGRLSRGILEEEIDAGTQC